LLVRQRPKTTDLLSAEETKHLFAVL